MEFMFYLSSKNRCTPSAYILFCKENRGKITQQFPSMRASDVSSLLSELWRKLPEEKKEEYRERVGIIPDHENSHQCKPLYLSTQNMGMSKYSQPFCSSDYITYSSCQVISKNKNPQNTENISFQSIKSIPSLQELQPMSFIPRYVNDIPPLIQQKANI